jgi:hypothetical protein
MSEEKKMTTTAGELEINSKSDFEEKLAEAIENNPNKPSEEEIEEAKTRFEEASKDFSIKSWDIGTPEKSDEFIEFIDDFMKNRIFWKQNGWMGVIKMSEEFEHAKNFIKAFPDQPIKFGYQAMEFLFYSLQNPGGIGLQAALDFQSQNEVYAEVFDAIGEQLNDARKELKEVQFLQEQYAAMQQGFYLEAEDGPLEEEVPEEEVPEEEAPEEQAK